MFPEGKIIEIFSMCDDFSKVFDTKVEKNGITGSATKKRKYHRDGRMSDSEVMTIFILFHNSGYRCFNLTESLINSSLSSDYFRRTHINIKSI